MKPDDAQFAPLRNAVRVQLAAYPERREVFDGRPSVRLRQLERLRDALRKTDRGARFLIEGLTTDRRGFPKPEIDLSDLEARIEGEIAGLRMELRGSSVPPEPQGLPPPSGRLPPWPVPREPHRVPRPTRRLQAARCFPPTASLNLEARFRRSSCGCSSAVSSYAAITRALRMSSPTTRRMEWVRCERKRP